MSGSPPIHTPTSSQEIDVNDQLKALTIRSDSPTQTTELSATSPPFSSWQQGLEVTSVVVGRGDDSRSFTMHTKLLTNSSPFFESAIAVQANGQHTLNLSQFRPTAFETVYQYLYAGDFPSTELWLNKDPLTDLDWLNVFKISVHTGLHGLASKLYDIFIKKLPDANQTFAVSEEFLCELFASEPTKAASQLQQLIVAMTAYSLLNITAGVWYECLWNSRFRCDAKFSALVLQRMSKLRAHEKMRQRRPKQKKGYMIYGGR